MKNGASKNSRSIKLFIVVLALALAVPVIQAVPTFAGNIEDTRCARWSDNSGGDMLTPARRKYDSTSLYAYNDRSHKKITVTAYAQNGVYGKITSGGCRPVQVPVGTYRYVPSYVYEWGYSHARLLVWPGSHASTYISFLWSPDSV